MIELLSDLMVQYAEEISRMISQFTGATGLSIAYIVWGAYKKKQSAKVADKVVTWGQKNLVGFSKSTADLLQDKRNLKPYMKYAKLAMKWM